MEDPSHSPDQEEEPGPKEAKVREELKTDKSGLLKVGDIVLIMMKHGNYCGMISADGVISPLIYVIPRESQKEKGANVLTRSCLFRIEQATKITNSTIKKSDYELKQSLGRALTYGERVQLRHLHSMNFISVNNQIMATKAGSLQVLMTEETNERCWFEIVTTNNLRKEGEIVRYTDSVCFVMVSKKSQCFLHADESKKLTTDSRIEVNASGSVNPWTIRRYTSYDLYGDASSFLRAGDSFRIFLKISGAYLTTKENPEGPVPEVFLQRNNLTSNSLREIQRPITFLGGTAQWNEKYRIKHVSTG